jgi:hypothetical protein
MNVWSRTLGRIRSKTTDTKIGAMGLVKNYEKRISAHLVNCGINRANLLAFIVEMLNSGLKSQVFVCEDPKPSMAAFLNLKGIYHFFMD